MIHSQVPFISLVKPVDYKYNSKYWENRVDFVITDIATKVIALIELDDSAYHQNKTVECDNYVNDVLKGHHSLIRIDTEKFYAPLTIAELLESEVSIKNKFASTRK